MKAHVHEAEVAAVTPLARDVTEWRLRPAAPVTFHPGQFLSVRVGEDEDGNAVLRSYSIASSPGEGELSLVLKLIPGGKASSYFRELAVGHRVRFTGPMGFFVLDFSHPGDVIFGATGVGIAPVYPMLRELLQRKEHGRVRLYWGNRDAEDLFWRDELDALAVAHPRLEVRRYLSGEAPTWTGPRGRITAPLLADVPGLERPTFYLVGAGAMIRDVRAGLIEQGVDRKRQIRNEVFFK